MTSKVMLVVIDGLGFQTAVEHCGFLESLVQAGKARRWKMASVLPSLSVPIYETLHSGVQPHDHGITSNDNVRMTGTDHVFKVARAQGRRTGAVAHFNFSELFNRAPFDPIEDMEVNDESRCVQYGRFYLQHGKTRFNIGLASEADLLNQASILVHRHAPDYLLLHSSGCDSVGHLYGGESPEYKKQAWATDDQIAQHLHRWQGAGYRVLVTADHGMSAFGHHGGNTDDVRMVAFYDIGHPKGGAAPELADQLSVAPTILDRMGLKIPKAMTAPPLP
ncbi:alkaline phosphatase family protein [Limibacillus halophilus]|uniref:Putative AlkP superfamily pyrophosphatase or phosphodiesterase n=1 Tax=Limibacillus halophilus TaxID=1579333 RepID=A0A839SXW4_9PROT|nr:alkaline phosphatase family protein [Limibacillus halophilus]MBB3065793.1 putative AlkP superfamily pyrophosphatase or phosphodiesterase [Limibacillus halophilus]